uniref:Kinesin motor domain-containing protein n=1 Tax=Anopheles dirus TaxID=7168 RepID=A0A182NVH2_9DIPT
MSGLECVKVAIRIRPMSQGELARGCQSVVEQATPDVPQILVCGGQTPSDVFTYSYVFSPGTYQSQLYATSVAPMLSKLFDGYNATILAYGQTSSGKTFTMGTDFSGELTDGMGVIPRAITDIFRTVEQNKLTTDARVTCSFIEVYQDNVYDLLAEKSRQQVEIREAVNGDIVLQGLTEVPATTDQCAFDCLARGAAGRVVRATAMNNVSSRSHAIFTLTLQQTSRDDSTIVTRSKFHLVDLAGSERSKKTATTGDRFKEGVEINKCLLALGNVITALGTATGTGKVHVPYRSSKLTRLLQDSLGGNSCTLMIACVSPADYNLSETYSTLRYAYRVCKIKNKPIINQDPQKARIKHLEGVIQDLMVQILTLKTGHDGTETVATDQDGKRPNSQQLVRSPLVRGLSDTELRSPSRQEPGAGAAQHKLQETVRSLQAQLRSTLHERETDEMRAMTAEKLLDDIERLLTTSVDETGDGQVRRDIGALLTTYKEEVFAVGIVGDGLRAAGKDDALRSEEIERKSEFHTQQQMRIHNELSQLKRELALKEELHRKYTGNSAAVQTLSSNRERALTEQLRDCEGQIRGLEEQLAELNSLLENTKASEKRSKLAEERRRKVQQLEAELAELRQTSKRQAKLLKMGEKDTQRMVGLNTEIQELKATRVRLLKTLRTESENYSQWRKNREKEISQLKAKDLKQQYEIQKLHSTHSMQRTVMQRKMQETILVNKRLKATLERRERNIGKGPAGSVLRGAEARRWIKHELELLNDTVDATVTLQILRTQRSEQTAKLNQLRNQMRETINLYDRESTVERRAGLEEELRQCQTDLDYRNAQIADLQQRIHTMDTDSQVVAFAEGLTKLPEARDAFQRMVEQLVQTQTRLIETRFLLVELQATSECQEEALAQARLHGEQAEQAYKEQVVQLEKTYEDKLSLLLTKPSSQSSSSADQHANGTDGTVGDNVHDEAIRRIEQLRDELELQKAENAALQQALDAATKPPVRQRKVTRRLIEDDFMMDDHESSVFDEDEKDEQEDEMYELLEQERDPDFRGTPLSKRKKNNGILSSSIQHTNLAMNNTSKMNGSATSCGCTGNCATKRCGCRKHGSFCFATCKCPPGCVNNALSIVDENAEASEESMNGEGEQQGAEQQQQNTNKENKFVVPHPPAPRVKDERDELDILEYVTKYRKRKPLLDW